jgi:signal transduction histidine kinase
VRHRDTQAMVEIRDDGRGTSAVRLPSGGHGLAGLRERTAAAGGTLQVGPRSGGGYRLAVRIPVATREDVSA